jgi:shikimate kinase
VDRHLWLIGMMGSGKSVTARLVAKRWSAPVLDTDDEVAARTGCSIAQLWGERGEEAFREMESAAIARIAEAAPAVIATGGGAVLDAGNVTAMRASGAVVWLTADPDVLSRRVGDGAGRPLLRDDTSVVRFREILQQRRSLYEAAADLVVDTSTLGSGAVADRIEVWWTAS